MRFILSKLRNVLWLPMGAEGTALVEARLRSPEGPHWYRNLKRTGRADCWLPEAAVRW